MTASRLGVAVVAGTVLAAGCSDDEKKKDSGRTLDASAESGVGGTGATAGTGGAAGTAGMGGSSGASGRAGSSGAAGVAGVAGAMPDASAGSGGMDAGLAGAGGVDAGTAGAAGVDAGTDSSADAGLVCSPMPPGEAGAGDGAADAMVLQWRDWSTSSCLACPAPPVFCQHLVGVDSTFDVASKVLVLTVIPGHAEVASATVTVSWQAVGADGGVSTGTASVAATINRDRIVADFTGQIPDGVFWLSSILPEIDDACGLRSADSGFSAFNNLLSGDGATTFDIYCEF